MKVILLLMLGALLGIALLPYLLFRQKELPAGTNQASPAYAIDEAKLLIDRTVWDARGERHILYHEIFDAMLAEVRSAETFLIADFFLWNPWTGGLDGGQDLRPLSAEFARALIEKRIEKPDMPMVVITDPINRIYGNMHPEFYDDLAAAGIPVVFTALDQLPDSNKIYAPQAEFWKKFLPAADDGEATGLVPNPFDPEGEKLSLAQFGRLLYFKANHRKVLITGPGLGRARVLMPSLNPADGSANHSNMGLLVEGPVAAFAGLSELEIARWSSEDADNVHGGRVAELNASIVQIEKLLRELPLEVAGVGEPSVAYRSELSIREEILLQLQQTVSGSRIDIGLFYFSDREVVEGLKAAIQRGAIARILLDANRDAFGREKNGIPNRTVAAELMELAASHPVELRWAATHGEQFHAKVLRIKGPQQDLVFLGSGNWTRRNLGNLNLEANLIVENSEAVTAKFDAYFDTLWMNADVYEESLPYGAWAEEGWSLTWKSWLYRFQEWSGASTF